MGLTNNSGAEWHPGVYIHGRAQYDPEHNGYTSYAVKFHPGIGVYLLKYYYNTDTSKWTYKSLGSKGGKFKDKFAEGAMLHAKVTFEDVAEGVKVSVTLTDADGKAVGNINSLSWTDTGNDGLGLYRGGSVYLSVDANHADAAENWTATFDDFKVTMDNRVVFKDTFTLAENQSTAE